MRPWETSQPTADAIRRQVDLILDTPIFYSARRSSAFLRYAVEKALAGTTIKEYEIAVDVMGRAADYDPAVDATVRVEAGRLRSRLRDYYESAGKSDPVLIEIPKGGYSAVFTWRGESSRIASPEVPAPTQARRGTGSHRWKLLVSIGIVFMLAVLAAVTIQRRNLKRAQASEPIRSLAVLPLEDLSPGQRDDYFADGLTDELITELARIPNLRVVSRTSVMQEKGKKKTLNEIARELGVDAIVEGSVVRSGDRVRFTTQLIDARVDRHLWAETFEGHQSDILSLQDDAAREIASKAQVALSGSANSREFRHLDPRAYDAYLQGRYFIERREADNSVAAFRKAVELEPGYASAWAGLATAYVAQTAVEYRSPHDVAEQAVEAANHALQLDPANGEAYGALGMTHVMYDWDWNAAGEDLRKAINLSPNDSLIEVNYAIYLDTIGRTADAVAHMQHAVELDPLSFFVNRHMGTVLYFARRYDEARQYLDRAISFSPEKSRFTAMWYSGIDLAARNFHGAAEAEIRGYGSTLSPQDVANLTQANTHGWNAYLQARLAIEMRRVSEYCGSLNVAISYMQLGRFDDAFRQLNRAVDERCYYAANIQVDPKFDPIRTDSRYAPLLHRIYGAGTM